ncbi:hypothetical protein [Pseudomonas oryzae]|uniref:Uncharacterized protein n=1 Tax=Pseudomonas oryzae TaxID=1392877 RepID=A0A1H1XA10_9PSED|nr:hypothetical protein [Pseudomonas oryzae]SDT05499.1 hypothetical protein SAMN05216221_3342 [Pseudomonas oryzae]
MPRASHLTLVVLGGAAMLAALALYWIRDTPLDRQASAWVAAARTQQKPSAGHLYLLGLDAAAEPMSAGRARLADYRQWRATHSPFDDGFQPAPLRQLDIPKLAAPHDRPGCLEPVRNAAYLTQGRELLARYRQAARLADLRRLIASEPAEPWPNFAALVTGNRLLALEACRLLLDGQPGQARALLEEDLGHWRRHLAAADSLIQKMVVAHLVASDIGTLAALYQQGLIEQPAPQPALTAAERSLQSAMQSEFAMQANGLAAMRDDPALITEKGRLALQLLYKPNMSSNAILPRYLHIAAASQLTASEFSGWLREQPQPPLHQDWRNPIGNILAAVAVPDMSQYLARLHDLDTRIQLFNRLNSLAPGFTVAQALSATAAGNPYGAGPARLLEASPPQLCYDGPLADPKHRRCLPLLGRAVPATSGSASR